MQSAFKQFPVLPRDMSSFLKERDQLPKQKIIHKNYRFCFITSPFINFLKILYHHKKSEKNSKNLQFVFILFFFFILIFEVLE